MRDQFYELSYRNSRDFLDVAQDRSQWRDAVTTETRNLAS
jgi:hypothetical protein